MGRNGILGRMGRELDSEILRRLQQQYGEMSDGELLNLAAEPDDLTEVALEVLRAEITHRGLKPGVAEASDAGGYGLSHPEFGTKLADGSVVLMTFHDAMAVGNACDFLEADGIEVNVRDVSEKGGIGTMYGGPPVSLQVIVKMGDQDRAVKILREKMGLFPLQEVEEADVVVDDGTASTLGYFGRREDAEEVALVLEEAGVWHRIAANEDGSAENEDAFTLEVKEVDLVRAGEVVEKAMGLPEG
jgi:hypothetical protein